MEILKTYPYFFANLPLLFLFVILPMSLRSGKEVRIAFYGGIGCIPCSMAAPLYNQDYWQPVRLGHLPYGIEDLIFTYIAGTAIWMGVSWWHRDELVIGTASIPKAISRLLPAGVYSGVCLAVFHHAGMDPTTAVAIVGLALIALFLWRRRQLWRLSVAGSIIFPIFYISVVNLQFLLWPNYLRSWNSAGPWAGLFLGIPLGEVLWSVTFGALWPALVATALDIRLRTPRVADARA